MQRDKRNLVSCKFVSVPCHLFLRYLYIFHFMTGSIYVNGCLQATNIGKTLPMALCWNKRGLQQEEKCKIIAKKRNQACKHGEIHSLAKIDREGCKYLPINSR